ncbi:MAG: CoA-binding protein [Candidatus Omnitrophica bacterium]|nr:CoA-binding protein [Candidatus Omnitrophota bacterium]MBU1997057.1 CoA-binding protein [Candidatus Omnitrophota bacterium]
MNVAIIGASNKEHRYSYMAFKLLKEKGHNVFPVHQRVKQIEGHPVFASIEDIAEELDTVTMYVNAGVSNTISDKLISKKPKRVIFNPGAENPELEYSLNSAGVETINACTLVMLKTNQF